jgi:hypothetical protein
MDLRASPRYRKSSPITCRFRTHNREPDSTSRFRTSNSEGADGSRPQGNEPGGGGFKCVLGNMVRKNYWIEVICAARTFHSPSRRRYTSV